MKTSRVDYELATVGSGVSTTEFYLLGTVAGICSSDVAKSQVNNTKKLGGLECSGLFVKVSVPEGFFTFLVAEVISVWDVEYLAKLASGEVYKMCSVNFTDGEFAMLIEKGHGSRYTKLNYEGV
jgi:hypothetical protein